MRVAFAAVLGLVVLASCSGGDGDGGPEPGTPLQVREPFDPATAATVVGVVRYAGDPPPRPEVHMAGDHACLVAHADPVLSRALVLNDGRVASALVHLPDASRWAFDPPTGEVEMDQKGCLFIPRVVAVRTGQDLTFVNSDPTLHNVQAVPKVNRGFNLAMPRVGVRRTKSFKKPEIFVPLKCDVHPWMAAAVAVLDHPCFALSGEDGAFTITGVPPGEHVIEARHEVLGAVQVRVTLAAGERKEVELVFPGKGGA